MHPSRKFQEFHVDKNIFPPLPSTSSGNPVGDFQRNNNFTMSDQPSHSPAAVTECGLSRCTNDKMNGLYGNSVNGSASNQPEEYLNLRYSDKNGYWDQNNRVAPWQPNEKNLHEANGISIYTSLGQLHSEKVSTVLPLLQGHVNQSKSYESSEITGKPHSVVQAQDFSRYGQSAHHKSNLNASGDTPKPSVQKHMSEENLQSRSLDPKPSSVGVQGQTCFQQSSNIQEKNGGTYRGLDSRNRCTDGKLPEIQKYINDIFAQNQLQISSSVGGSSANNDLKGYTENEKTLSSAASALTQPLKEEPTKKVETDRIGGHELKKKEQTSFIKTDDAASKASEKLWNGTLQLSSSVKLSAAAYFRSGEKMPDICWSNHVEVKGKVRLEAFEKYIQDLPRSRNRAIMVMSIRFREGSTKEELKVMNEEIKKYKNGKRVGRAQLSPGVDVYICPISKTVNTILKGLVAVEDYQDPLIGCVVWRKNTSSEPGYIQLGNESISVEKPRAEAVKKAAEETLALGGETENKNTKACNLQDIHSIVKQLTEIEASLFQSIRPSTEDDDLPEYDFGDAIPDASSSNPLEAQKDVYGGRTPSYPSLSQLSTTAQFSLSLSVESHEVFIQFDSCYSMKNNDTAIPSSSKIIFDDSEENDSSSDEEAELELELADIPFGELQKARSDGTLALHQKSKPEKKTARANKNRPMEMSSKKPVARFREVIQAPKKIGRDPRFESLCGNFDPEGFKKRYSFIYEEQLPSEKAELLKQLKKSKDPEVIADLKSRISEIEKQLKSSSSTKNFTSQILTAHKKKEREAAKQGKKPFYLKKSEVRKQNLVQKYDSLKAAGKLDAYIEKRRKRNASKDKRFMPYRRPDNE